MGTAAGGDTPGLVDAIRWLPRGLRSAAAHRARWGIVDQSISSFTNFAVTAVVAHQVAPTAFGAFSVALTLYICVLWVARSVVGEPFVVRLTGSGAPEQTEAAREAVGAAVMTGAGFGLAAVGLGLMVGGPTGAALAVMGLFLPALVAQDAYRYVLMARGRARAATANDGLWLAVQTTVIVVLLATGRATATGLIVAFGGAAAAGAAFGIRQTGAVPSLGRSGRWLRRHVDLWVPFLLELLTINATPQLSLLAVAALGDVVTVGQVRAGMFLFAPLGVLFSGLFLVCLPEAVRLRARSLTLLRIFLVALAVAMVALTAAWATGLSLLPSRFGQDLLKANWVSGRQLVWPMAALVAASAAIFAAMVGLRALEVARQTIHVRIWGGPIVFVSGIAGAQLGDASGAVTGLALSVWLAAGLAWLLLLRALRAAPVYGARPTRVARAMPARLVEDQGPWAGERA